MQAFLISALLTSTMLGLGPSSQTCDRNSSSSDQAITGFDETLGLNSGDAKAYFSRGYSHGSRKGA